MMSNFEMVGQFHEIFGHPKHNVLQKNIFRENPTIIKLRLNLINEEINELKAAIVENNLVDVIDALGDILYVVYGTGHALGINLDTAFQNYIINIAMFEDEVAYEDERLDTIGNKSNFELVKLIIKSNETPPANSIGEIFAVLKSSIHMITDDFNILQQACEEENMDLVSRFLNNLLNSLYETGYYCNIDLDKAFSLVHCSNMTKLCKNEDEAKETIEQYKTLSGFETTDVRYRLSPDGINFTIYNATTGKILKSKYFKLPDFTEMINSMTNGVC